MENKSTDKVLTESGKSLNVAIRDLVKDYAGESKKPFRAVKSINLDIEDREFMVLVGPSGCGKSTVLRMIAGLEEITSGTISIDNLVVNDKHPKDRDIAMVFQNYALYPHMTVFDNIAFGLKIRRTPKDEVQRLVSDAAKILGIESLLYRKPKALSGGQRQRVAVGRAIVRQPKVFLFDEPLSNLDAKMRVLMRAEIIKLHTRLDATMIYVTHDQVEAMTMGDRICVMKDGEIMQVNTPIKIYNDPANVFVGGFIGSPPMNFFNGRFETGPSGIIFVEEANDHSGFRIRLNPRLSEIAQRNADKSVILGVRAEDILGADSDLGDGTDVAFESTVDMSELMGSEIYLYLKTQFNSFIAKVKNDRRYPVGSSIRVRFDLERAHLFDVESEKNLDESIRSN
jgi:multiple sugar transport system ATP-binding protein